MAERDDGGPAFAAGGFSIPHLDEFHYGQSGMTLRDWFAGQAMAQMVPHIMFPQAVEDQLHRNGVKTEDFEAYTAFVAYKFADAMIAERGGK